MPGLSVCPESRRRGVPVAAPEPAIGPRSAARQRAFCADIGRLAVRSLYTELALYPKPGLVSLIDNGSHTDMTAATFLRSLFALRHYFIQITQAGMDDAPFATLQWMGMAAEQKMLAATKGINTHRGAIFSLGMLCAAIGHCKARHVALSASAIRAALLGQWGDALKRHMQSAPPGSHGSQIAAVYVVYAASGAREEAALGLPSVFGTALPALQRSMAAGRSWNHACIDALFSLMAHINDTNVYHRGGQPGALTVKRCAQHFLSEGGTAHPDWQETALACHRLFIRDKLSPGGAADLLAAACLVYRVGRHYRAQ